MKKEQFFKLVLCLVTMGILIGASIPTVSSVDPPTSYWIVTDGVEDPLIANHYFYTVFGYELWSNHTQEWWCDEDVLEYKPISEYEDIINTTIEAWAVVTGPEDDHVALYVETIETDQAQLETCETVTWTVIGGNTASDPEFMVGISWWEWTGTWDWEQHYEELEIEIGRAHKELCLGEIQELDLSLKYEGIDRSPGQKYYWIAFPEPGQDPEDPDDQEWELSQIKQTTLTHNYPAQWWQNYTGTPSEIWEEGWHINHKVDFYTDVSGSDAILYVKMYSQNNFWPEWFNWTIWNGNTGDQEFQVASYDGDGNLEFNETATTSWQQKECGTLDNFTLWVQYTDP